MSAFKSTLYIISCSIFLLSFDLQLCSSNPLPADKFTLIIPKRPFPIEFDYLVESLQFASFVKPEIAINQKELARKIIRLEQIAPLIKSEEITLFFKEQIYQMVLETQQNKKKVSIDFNTQMLDQLRQILADDSFRPDHMRYHPFALWLMTTIFYDLEKAIKDPNFRLIKLMEAQGGLSERDDLLKLKKRVEFLYPWYELVTQLNAKEFNEYLLPMMQKILDELTLGLENFAQIGQGNPIPTMNPELENPNLEQLKFFSTKDLKINNLNNAAKTAEDIINQLNFPKAQGEMILRTWAPKDLPTNYPTPDPSYRAPLHLPKPINDW